MELVGWYVHTATRTRYAAALIVLRLNIYIFRLGCTVILQHCQLLPVMYLRYCQRPLTLVSQFQCHLTLYEICTGQGSSESGDFCFPSSHRFFMFIYDQSLKCTNSPDQQQIVAGKSKFVCMSISVVT
jgi:hypothetical protein